MHIGRKQCATTAGQLPLLMTLLVMLLDLWASQPLSPNLQLLAVLVTLLCAYLTSSPGLRRQTRSTTSCSRPCSSSSTGGSPSPLRTRRTASSGTSTRRSSCSAIPGSRKRACRCVCSAHRDRSGPLSGTVRQAFCIAFGELVTDFTSMLAGAASQTGLGLRRTRALS